MPTKFKSPFATSFNSAIKRGTPCNQAVWNISKRTNKPVNKIYESLWKAGFCNRQKFNGQWIYWANNPSKSNATSCKESQFNQWQWFVDWAIASGFCTPEQLNNNKGSQQEFMSFCKKFFAKQFNGTTTSSKSGRKASTSRVRKSTAKTTTARKRTSTKRKNSSSYKFPKAKSTSRRYRRAA